MSNPRGQSPLRYPGGKACLTRFITELAHRNELEGGNYVELYAGGAGAALNLLYNGTFDTIHINDYDYNIYAFWHSVIYETDAFIQLIEETPVTMDEWYRQREIFGQGRHIDPLTLGFATFFLNRTNRSGIIFKAGPIGGFEQTGNYLIDVRFNKEDLIKRVEKIGRYANKIRLTNMDATEIIRHPEVHIGDLDSSFLYLDPPYYNKGQQLYLNNYGHDGHLSLAGHMMNIPDQLRWMISYDNTNQIKEMYHPFRLATFNLNYTLQSKTFGSELLIFGNSLILGTKITVNSRTSDLTIFRYPEYEPANPEHIAEQPAL